MEYPKAAEEKVKWLAQLLHRVSAGERLSEMNEELGFKLDEKQLAKPQGKYEAGGGQWEAVVRWLVWTRSEYPFGDLGVTI